MTLMFLIYFIYSATIFITCSADCGVNPNATFPAFITVDGHFGAQSRRAADDYLCHGGDITLDAAATIEDYYRAVFGLPPLETEAAGD